MRTKRVLAPKAMTASVREKRKILARKVFEEPTHDPMYYRGIEPCLGQID